MAVVVRYGAFQCVNVELMHSPGCNRPTGVGFIPRVSLWGRERPREGSRRADGAHLFSLRFCACFVRVFAANSGDSSGEQRADDKVCGERSVFSGKSQCHRGRVSVSVCVSFSLCCVCVCAEVGCVGCVCDAGGR